MSKNVLTVGLAGLSLIQSGAAMAAMPEGGVFIPRNGTYEGCMGLSHVQFDAGAGGVMRVVTGSWPKLEAVAQFDMVFALSAAGSDGPVEVRQSFDRSPKILFLEEGNDRIGLRVLFKLYDGDNIYHGHGMTETWLYPDGQMFVTAAATFENTPAHRGVLRGSVEVDWAEPTKLAAYGPKGKRRSSKSRMPLETPGQYFSFAPRDGASEAPGMSLYWRTGRMAHNTFVGTAESGAPTYYRWPDYFRQAYGQGHWAEAVKLRSDGVTVQFPKDAKGATAKFNTLFRIVVGAEGEALERMVEADRDPVELVVAEGGVIHGKPAEPKDQEAGRVYGYNDLEGCYEVRKTGEPMVVTLPADASGRTIRVKAVALRGHGAVVAELDGAALVPQLTTDGGIADDPLAPIRQQPEAPADAAMVTVKLTDEAQTLTFREVEGIQLAYQTRDAWRNFAIYSSKTGPRWSGLRFSMVDGHARNMRAYENPEWALSENLLHWFSFCGYTPEQMLDQLRDFVVIKNGPDEVVFKYTSSNENDGAQSEFVVSSRADAPAMQIDVAATFTVLEQWPYKSSQFFDVFPFRGVWTQDWWYGNVLWLTEDGRWKTMDTLAATFEGDKELADIRGGGFFSFYSSDRGNMMMLTKNFKPDVPTKYVICGNYVDYHMEMLFVDRKGKSAMPVVGFQASCEYELAVWGDGRATRDELMEIGQKSIEAGALTLDGE